MEISAIEKVGNGLSKSFTVQETQGSLSGSGEGFGKLVEEMVAKVSDLQQQADQSIHSLATGQAKGLHEVMIAVEKASISLQFLSQVRNKAVEAYQEIMRMSV